MSNIILRTQFFTDSEVLETLLSDGVFFYPKTSDFFFIYIYFGRFPENPSIRVFSGFRLLFFRIFVTIFSTSDGINETFSKRLKNFAENRKIYSVFPIFQVFFCVFSQFFKRFSTGIFSMNRLHKNVTFLKRLKKFA